LGPTYCVVEERRAYTGIGTIITSGFHIWLSYSLMEGGVLQAMSARSDWKRGADSSNFHSLPNVQGL
jgi:hypothetical protein